MKLVKMEGPAPKARQPRFYRSPMNPAQTSAVPAKDSMGMDYVPVYDDEIPAHSEVDGLASIEIDASRQQLIGLRTAMVDTRSDRWSLPHRGPGERR
jgi:Cu(I)/Ag(I) efflux system membrane fusion protein